MRLTRAGRGQLLELLVKLTEATRLIKDSSVAIATGKRAAHKKADFYAKPLRDAGQAIDDSLWIIGNLMNSTQEATDLMGQFMLEASSMDIHHTRKLAEEIIDECMGPHTVLDDLVDAMEDPDVPPPRHDVRAWVYVEDGKIHIEISAPHDPDAEPEMVGSFGVDDVKEAHEFLVKANVATGLYASSCFHPDEEGLPEDLDVQEWVRKARHWNG